MVLEWGHRMRIVIVCAAEIENHAGVADNDAIFLGGECTCGTLVVAEWAHQMVTECALQTCAPQKLKIDAGANTSLTRRANPPEDSGSSSERAGASSNAAQSNAARAPECILTRHRSGAGHHR